METTEVPFFCFFAKILNSFPSFFHPTLWIKTIFSSFDQRSKQNTIPWTFHEHSMKNDSFVVLFSGHEAHEGLRSSFKITFGIFYSLLFVFLSFSYKLSFDISIFVLSMSSSLVFRLFTKRWPSSQNVNISFFVSWKTNFVM